MTSEELYSFDAQFPGLHAFSMFPLFVIHDGPILEVFIFEDLTYTMVGFKALMP